MKTDFSILWVDDNKDFVDSLLPALKDWLDTHGFALDPVWHGSEAGIYEDLEAKNIELIVLDYDLRADKKGDQIIIDIRKKNDYQDIIFYSEGGTHQISFTTPPDGVFFVNKADAASRIRNLIELKIRRASDLPTLRGWIVADSIVIEHQLGKVLGKCFGTSETMFTKNVLQREGLFDFYKKLCSLNGIVNDLIAELNKTGQDADKLAKLKSCKEILNKFTDEIIHVRNAIAHQGDVVDGGTRQIIINKKAVDFTPEWCANTRKNIRKHSANLIELEKLI